MNFFVIQTCLQKNLVQCVRISDKALYNVLKLRNIAINKQQPVYISLYKYKT